MKTLGIITYQTEHLKTEQIILNLAGRYNLKLFALPFVSRPQREVLFQHRPDQTKAAHPRELCERFGFDYIPIVSDTQITDDCDLYIAAAGRVLSEKCVRNKKILNAHPGVIPAARGLDAFKWSVYHKCPLGVTLHYIDEQIDAGEIISIVPTPVFLSDTLETLARRHYEAEIRMLCNFEKYMQQPVNAFPDILQQDPTRRMNMEKERKLAEKFEEYKARYAAYAGRE